MLLVSLSAPVLDIARVYFYAWAAPLEGQRYPSTAQYNPGSW